MHDLAYCLGFDFGMKKIGVAVGQFVTRTASPLPCLLVTKGKLPWDIIRKLIVEWQPEYIVIGYPKTLDGQALSITSKVEVFAKSMREFGIPVFLSDERMTTKEARQTLFSKGGFKALAYGKADSIAAAIILEQWMNERSSPTDLWLAE